MEETTPTNVPTQAEPIIKQTRQQRRKELRDINKSIKKAVKTKEYRDTQLYFETLQREDYLLLQENKHTDPVKQERYDHYIRNMKYLVSLEARRDFLLGNSRKLEQNA